MSRNVEIKAKVTNLQHLLKAAETLANRGKATIKQHDTFYKVQQGRLKLRQFEDNSAELIYYERPDTTGPKTSSYEKAVIDAASVASIHKILDKTLGAQSVVKKVRQLFLVDQTRVHVDTVEGLGDFMELEVVLEPEQTPEEGEAIAYSLMEKLGVKKEDLVSGAYTDLLNAK